MTAEARFTPPERYELKETLVENDAEVLYRGVDRTLLREVILKRPGRGLAVTLADTGDAPRALREARALARLSHDGVVRLIDVVECPGGPLLVMEPIPGETLADLLEREGKLAPAQVVRLGRGLAAALQAVHAAGAVHRGLSTANIIVRPDGSPCLAGFLFAKFMKSSLGISSISYAPGLDRPPPAARRDAAPKVLPCHPAPEQLYSQGADGRSDIFGLGSVLYRALTGQDAFPHMLTSGWTPPRPPHEIDGAIPHALSALVMKCLARSPLGRFQSAVELEQALVTCPLGAVHGSRALRGLVAAAAALFAVALLAAAVRSFRGGEPPDDRRPASGAPAASAAGDGREVLVPVYENSYALLIGINEYEDREIQPLPNAVRDIEAIARRLEEMSWEEWQVILLKGKQATRQAIEETLVKLTEHTAQTNDRLFIYYAGHGEAHMRRPDWGWILPYDARRNATRTRYLDFKSLTEPLEASHAKHTLLAIDCCYSGRVLADPPERPSDVEGPRAWGSAGDAELTTRARLIITSGRPYEAVVDGPPGETSPFAAAFLEMLQTDQDILLSSDLHYGIRNWFRKHQSGGQKPNMTGYGEFLFFLQERP